MLKIHVATYTPRLQRQTMASEEKRKVQVNANAVCDEYGTTLASASWTTDGNCTVSGATVTGNVASALIEAPTIGDLTGAPIYTSRTPFQTDALTWAQVQLTLADGQIIKQQVELQIVPNIGS